MVKIWGLALLIGRSYINSSETASRFRLKKELTVVLLKRVLQMNIELFKRAEIVKEVIIPTLDFVAIENCDSLHLLNDIETLWIKNKELLLIALPNGSKVVQKF